MSHQDRQERIATKIRMDLASGRVVSDALFDGLLSHKCFDLSRVHWTPLDVTRAALDLLQPTRQSRILDVGSGCGKFCLVAAMSAPGNYTGIELRPELNEESRRLQALFRAKRVDFRQGDACTADWSRYTGFYLYNPFYENILAPGDRHHPPIDTSIDLNEDRFRHFIHNVQNKLQACLPGTQAVSFHGFGSGFPVGWVRRRLVKIGNGELELWVKTG